MFSKNTITAQVMQVVGPARGQPGQVHGRAAKQAGPEVPSLALGTSPVTLKEMVTAYGTMANDGATSSPSW
jgi:penicillin-binding protein 1A